MKKLHLLLVLCLFISICINAQENILKINTAQVNPVRSSEYLGTTKNLNNKIATASINDTLHYFYNKHYYRNIANGTPTSPNTQFYTLSAPYPGALSISHCGSIFLNSSSLTVNGLEGIVYKNTSAPSQNVPVKLYLCNLNALNLPIFPPLDSITTNVPNTPNGGIWVGGNFTTPIVMNGKFAVLFKNASTNPLDTIRLFINNASTPTSTVPIAQRYGEGLGLMRITGNFQITTNTFGTGTDYEYIVAPRVSFAYTSSVTVLTPSICINSNGSFSNTTSNVTIPMNILENRQFNFNKFANVWGALSNSILPQTQPDSIYNWTFSGSNTGSLTTKNATAFFNIQGIQQASLTVKYKVSANAGFYFSTNDVSSANIFVTATLSPSLTISGTNTICAGGTTTLTASGNPTFTWTIPSSNLPTIIVSPTVNTIYAVSGVNGACVGTQTILVSVFGIPIVSVSGASAACVGNTITLTAAGASSYSWSTSANTASIAITSSISGVQSLTVVGQNANCPGSSFYVQNINFNSLPNVSLSVTNATMCTKATNGATVALIGTPPGGVFSGNVTSLGVFNPLTVGIFTANYSYTNSLTGCSKLATQQLVVTNCTNLNNQILNSNLLIYPIPSIDGMVYLENLDGRNTLEVFSLIGDLVYKQITNSQTEMLNLLNYPSGYYFVKITDSNGKSKAIKIIK